MKSSKMPNLRRALSLILASLLLLLTAACGEAPNSEESSAVKDTSLAASPSADTETEAEEDAPPLAYLGEHDFKGRTYTMLVSGMDNDEWRYNPIDADPANAEIINSEKFKRNVEIEDTLNCSIASIEMFGNSTISAIQEAIQAYDEVYNSAMLLMADAAKVTVNGYVTNLLHMDELHLDGYWWDQRSVEDMTINGQLYHVVNSNCEAAYNATCAILFNKVLEDKYQIPSPYDYVLEGKWTFDVLKEMIKDISTDLDGNGVMDDKDLYGLLLWKDCITAAVNSSMEYCCQVDADGVMQLTLNSEQVQNIVDKFNSFATDRNITMDYMNRGYNSYDVFPLDLALFYMQEINRIHAFRDMESDFGVLPMPKYSEEQPVYRNLVADTDGVLLTVPIVISNEEFTGTVLEALARLSEEYVMPAYYDVTLQRKAARDEESRQMLEIIFSTRAYDLGWTYLDRVKLFLIGTVNGQNSNINAFSIKHGGSIQKTLDEVNDFYSKGK